MTALLSNRRTRETGCYEHERKPAIALSVPRVLKSVVRATSFASHPGIGQADSLKGCTRRKRGGFWGRLLSHIMFVLVCIGLFFLNCRQAKAQVAYDFGCGSTSERTTVGNDPGIRPPYQELFTQLQACPPQYPTVSELPDAPSAVSSSKAGAGWASERSLSEPDVRDLAVESYTGKEPKTIDRQFLALNALLVISAVADAESTLLCSRCREVNPLLGSHPTRQRIYAIGVPLTAFQIYLAYHYKRLSPTRNGVITGWKAFPIAFAAIHSLAAANNFLVAHYTQ
jgi:hypothetical protein